MDMLTLATAPRSTEKPNRMRMGGSVPCVVYGNIANTTMMCAEGELTKALKKAGESTLVELEVDGKKVPSLFHKVDLDPVSGRIIHVDFYAVDMKKEVEATVHLRFTGESPAIKEHGAVFVVAAHEVTVRCLPKDLPHDLTVDISSLAEVGATLTVGNITLPAGVAILEEKDRVIAIAQEPREEEVVVAPVAADAAAVAGAAPGAPGAAPAAGAPAAAAAPTAEGKKK